MARRVGEKICGESAPIFAKNRANAQKSGRDTHSATHSRPNSGFWWTSPWRRSSYYTDLISICWVPASLRSMARRRWTRSTIDSRAKPNVRGLHCLVCRVMASRNWSRRSIKPEQTVLSSSSSTRLLLPTPAWRFVMPCRQSISHASKFTFPTYTHANLFDITVTSRTSPRR